MYIACCVNGKKSTTQGKRIPSTQKPPDIITSGSIIQYFRKHINLLSAILRREFLESVQPTTTVQASKQASTQAYMVKHAIVNTKASLIGLQGTHQAQQHTQCKERMQMQCNIATTKNNKTTHHNHHHHHHHHHLLLHHLTRNLVL